MSTGTSTRALKTFRGIAAAMAVLATPLAAVSGAIEATAASTPPTAIVAAGSGWARFGHFAPESQPVNVLVDGQPFASDLGFKSVSRYLPLPAGPHRFELRAASAPDGPTLLTVEAGVPDGGAVTVSAVTTRDGIASQVFDDALSTPPTGQALVRFIHAAPDIPAVDVQVTGGPVLASDVMYPWASGYQPIAPGNYDVEVKAAGTADVLLHINSWTIDPGAQSSIVIVKGTDGQLDVVPVRDAAAVAVAPVGGVQTDYGELVSPQHRSPLTSSVYVGLMIALAAAGCYCTLRLVRVRRAGAQASDA